ncbi:MAG: hypothetical protein NTZ78_14730 [Candidatus Aureabacteria bacterium]|nr:hypothetical protein [Candidatus Auribacterota bacterium]
MKKSSTAVLGLMFAVGMVGIAVAGGTDSPGSPSGGSGMYSLQNLYDYIVSGTALDAKTNFQEPGAAPGSTMKTTKDIGDALKAILDQCTATSDVVMPGYTFFCTKPGIWGVQTGNYATPTPTTTPTSTPTITPIPTWSLNQNTCNAISGWHWYSTNGRSACWSKTLADSVSWNKGVSDNPRVTGTYTCVSNNTLKERMEAAAAGEWYKIVSNVAGTSITSTHNAQSGASLISALAISDCVDGLKDLSDCGGACTDWSSTNTWLRNWAGATGKSALPYLADGAGSSGNNDYETACASNSNDLPLGCPTPVAFYLNRKACTDSDINYCAGAASGEDNGGTSTTHVRGLGCGSSCSAQDAVGTSNTNEYRSFRVVVRP